MGNQLNNTSHNATDQVIPMNDIDPSVEHFQLVVYVPTFIFGLLFNIMALWMLFFRIKKWLETTTYVTALIFFDFLLLLTLPFKIRAYDLGKDWDLGPMTCTFLESLYFVNMYGSILISVCIGMDRYIAIQHPFYANDLRSPKKATAICILTCILVWSFSLGYMYKQKDKMKRKHCFYGFSDTVWMNVTLVTVLELVFIISATILTFCTTRIVLTLKKRTRLNSFVTSPQRSIKVVIANLLIFLFSFIPFHISLILYHLVKTEVILPAHTHHLRIFIQVALCIANINCCLDAMCYYFIFKEFLN
ncbi:G-protein coupled receptor 55-like [Bombina bombina]|uniref:G-protein coupled receptor 55-like n=1 Tax=Bombina bombina TaxID=8345 RepID=UPI00235A4E4F|nr:G-protein coupled receptor 55-like [Bombina bombina]